MIRIPSTTIQNSCLRIIGNIASGTAGQTQQLLNSNALQYLSKTLFHEKKTVRKETCWIISNLAAGTQQQIEALITHNYLPLLSNVIKNDLPEVFIFIL